LVALAEGFAKKRSDDTLDAVLAAPDRAELIGWLRTRRLMHVEKGFALVHAGLLPQWGLTRARELADEVALALTLPGYRDFLAHLYGSQPERWDDALAGWDRLRVIVNAMTRMRFCTSAGKMEFHRKGLVPPRGFRAWFDLRPADEAAVFVCGHWSALGLRNDERLVALDTGCVWGGTLSAVRLEDRAVFQVSSRTKGQGGET
jgi:bis(5'-nucleosyl)-tetraphosphatase (symmetrical)